VQEPWLVVLHHENCLTSLYSWLPLLFIPTNASPIFIFLFFICTYFLNRPCVYCSFLLLILFASSCHWSDHCFFDFSANWFSSPSSLSSSSPLSSSNYTSVGTSNSSEAMSNATFTQDTPIDQALMYLGAFNQTAAAIAASKIQELGSKLPQRAEWTGIGVGWLRSLLGTREWRLPCVDVYVRL